MRVLILGGGIAGEILLDQLLRNSSHLPFHEYFLFHHDQLAPPCTLTSTAIIARRGISMGVTPLGDELLESFHLSIPFYDEFKTPIKSSHYYIGKSDDSVYLRRVSKLETVNPSDFPLELNFDDALIKKEMCFIIPPHLFMKEIKEKNSGESIFRRNEFINKIESKNNQWHLESLQNKYSGDVLLLATGAYYQWIEPFFEPIDNELSSSQGSYLSFKVDLGEKSYSITTNNVNLIYRADEKIFLIGGIIKDQRFFKPINHDELKDAFNEALKIFPTLHGKIFFENSEILCGVRSRGKHRRMVVEQLNQKSKPDAWIFTGFYKNGYSLPLLGAQKIIDNYKGASRLK